MPKSVSFFGLLWNRETDLLSTKPLLLDGNAKTKRAILSSIAGNYDLLNFTGPLLNRARIFMHNLQLNKELDWDTELSQLKLKEWKTISKQVNSSPLILIERFVGDRESSYKLIAFTDSSKTMYGAVLYLYDINVKKVSFLLAKNRIVNQQLETKSIPSLEMEAIHLGAQILMDTYGELTGKNCLIPCKIGSMELFTDSLVCLNWLNASVNGFDKMKNQSNFVKNRIGHIIKVCQVAPISFKFCEGMVNPADCITRPLSHKLLMQSNYHSGPDIRLLEAGVENLLSITIPNPLCKVAPESQCMLNMQKEALNKFEDTFSLNHISDLDRQIKIVEWILTFVDNLKFSLFRRNPDKFGHLKPLSKKSLKKEAFRILIVNDQKQNFPEVFHYFEKKRRNIEHMPNLVSQLNLYLDETNILRVKSKFNRWTNHQKLEFPVFLAKSSQVTEKLIIQYHKRTSHGGLYMVLKELRKNFWIQHIFSTVKRILRKCVHCRRYNDKPIQLNQNSYRLFRSDPPNVPYRYVFIDYFGPWIVTLQGCKTKVYVLCITCLWSRAINLKLCLDLSVSNLLRALQCHIYEYGIPQLCLSDLGSQIVAGSKEITNFLNDAEVSSYLAEHNMKPLQFDQYFKGCHQLGSLVEICVKLTKKLIYGAIGQSILDYFEFNFIIQQTIHLVNRRPIAFKEFLRSNNSKDECPSPITPEMLIKGYELVSLNIVPDLQAVPEDDPDWVKSNLQHIKDNYAKLRKARGRLVQIYNEEFKTQLVNQAVDKKYRYQPVNHKPLREGDIVLLKEPLTKRSEYPMGIVQKVQLNDIGESTGAEILKGSSKELVKRHANCIIPLLRRSEYNDLPLDPTSLAGKVKPDDSSVEVSDEGAKPRRKAALDGQTKTRQFMDEGLI